MVKTPFSNETGCASSKYVRTNGLARPAESTSLAQSSSRSLEAGGGAEAAWLSGASDDCGAVAGMVDCSFSENWDFGTSALDVRRVTSAAAGAEAGAVAVPPAPRNAFNCFRTVSRLIALRASMALSNVTSTRIFLDDVSRSRKSASANTSRTRVKASADAIADCSLSDAA